MRTDDKGGPRWGGGGGTAQSVAPRSGLSAQGLGWFLPAGGRPRTAHLAGTPAPSMRLNSLRHIRHFP